MKLFLKVFPLALILISLMVIGMPSIDEFTEDLKALNSSAEQVAASSAPEFSQLTNLPATPKTRIEYVGASANKTFWRIAEYGGTPNYRFLISDGTQGGTVSFQYLDQGIPQAGAGAKSADTGLIMGSKSGVVYTDGTLPKTYLIRSGSSMLQDTPWGVSWEVGQHLLDTSGKLTNLDRSALVVDPSEENCASGTLTPLTGITFTSNQQPAAPAISMQLRGCIPQTTSSFYHDQISEGYLGNHSWYFINFEGNTSNYRHEPIPRFSINYWNGSGRVVNLKTWQAGLDNGFGEEENDYERAGIPYDDAQYFAQYHLAPYAADSSQPDYALHVLKSDGTFTQTTDTLPCFREFRQNYSNTSLSKYAYSIEATTRKVLVVTTKTEASQTVPSETLKGIFNPISKSCIMLSAKLPRFFKGPASTLWWEDLDTLGRPTQRISMTDGTSIGKIPNFSGTVVGIFDNTYILEGYKDVAGSPGSVKSLYSYTVGSSDVAQLGSPVAGGIGGRALQAVKLGNYLIFSGFSADAQNNQSNQLYAKFLGDADLPIGGGSSSSIASSSSSLASSNSSSNDPSPTSLTCAQLTSFKPKVPKITSQSATAFKIDVPPVSLATYYYLPTITKKNRTKIILKTLPSKKPSQTIKVKTLSPGDKIEVKYYLIIKSCKSKSKISAVGSYRLIK